MTNKHLHIGPGGKSCTCCFPAPGSKDRRAKFRSAKRRAEREALQEAFTEIEDAKALEFEQTQADYAAAGYDGSPWDYEEHYYDKLFDPSPDPVESYHDDYGPEGGWSNYNEDSSDWGRF